MLHRRRGPDLPGGTGRAAGSRARRADRRDPCRSATATIMSTASAIRRRPKRRRSSPAIPISIFATAAIGPAAIYDGDLLTGSLTVPGLRHFEVHPDWSTMQPLARPEQEYPWRKQYDDETPRPDHERCDRPDGLNRIDPLDHRDPRRGRRGAERRPARRPTRS